MSDANGGTAGGSDAPASGRVEAYVGGAAVAIAVMLVAVLVVPLGLLALVVATSTPGPGLVIVVVVALATVVLVPAAGIYAGIRTKRRIRSGGSGSSPPARERGSPPAAERGPPLPERIDEVATALSSVDRDLPAARTALDRAERYHDHDAETAARQTVERTDRMIFVEGILRRAVELASERPVAGDRVDRVVSSLARAEDVAGHDVDRAADLLEEALATTGPLSDDLRRVARDHVDRASEAADLGDADRARREYDRAIDLLETAMALDDADPIGHDPVGEGSDSRDGDPRQADADRLERWRAARDRVGDSPGDESDRDRSREEVE